MSPHVFDEERLVHTLRRLPAESRVTFSAACAERLAPAYVEYSQRTSRGDATTLLQILARLWSDLESGTSDAARLRGDLDRCMSLIPRADNGPWIQEQPAAEDAAAALAYALRCRQEGESQDAAWAARRAYDAIDYFVSTHENIVGNQAVAQRLAHPLVQAELFRQQRDLDELLSAGFEPPHAVVTRLRERARMESATVFGHSRTAD